MPQLLVFFVTFYPYYCHMRVVLTRFVFFLATSITLSHWKWIGIEFVVCCNGSIKWFTITFSIHCILLFFFGDWSYFFSVEKIFRIGISHPFGWYWDGDFRRDYMIDLEWTRIEKLTKNQNALEFWSATNVDHICSKLSTMIPSIDSFFLFHSLFANRQIQEGQDPRTHQKLFGGSRITRAKTSHNFCTCV